MKICPKCGTQYSDETQFCPVDGSTLDASPQQTAGASGSSGTYKVAGRYALGEMKERRPVGDIYVSVDESSGKKLSLLLVSPHVLPSEVYKNQVLRELGRLTQMSSDHVVKVSDKGTIDDGRVFAVLDDPIETTLAGWVGSQGSLSLEKTVKVISDLALGLKEHQAAGIVHRELSPGNIILEKDGSAKLLNLGVASSLGNNIFGDAWFMAPEQTLGHPVDIRSNIYSLGAVFYYALVGATPFQDTDPAVLFERHRSGNVEPPSKRRPDLGLSAEVDAFVLKAMSKDGASRHFTLDQFIKELSALAKGASVPVSEAAAAVPPPGAASEPPPPDAASEPPPPDAASEPPPPEAPHPGGGESAPSAIPVSPPSASATQPKSPSPSQAPVSVLRAPQPRPVVGTPSVAPVAALERGGEVESSEAEATTAGKATTTEKQEDASPAQADGSSRAARGRRRRRKGDFRVTMWFKKGAAMEGDGSGEGEAEGEEDLTEVTAGDGSISESERSIDDRYKDDGSITREDQAEYSLRTGQTGMMPAVEMTEDVSPGRAMDEKGAVKSLDRRRKILVFLAFLFCLALLGAFAAYFYQSRIPETFVQKGVRNQLASKVPEFTFVPKIKMPGELKYPEGKAKELWSLFVKSIDEQEEKEILPSEGYGAGHYLVAFEKAMDKIPEKMKRRRRKKVKMGPFEVMLGPRKAEQAQKKFVELREKVIKRLRGVMGKVKGKIYLGEGDEKKYIRALTAGRILMDLVQPFDGKDEVKRDLARLKTNFKAEKSGSGSSSSKLSFSEAFANLKEAMKKKIIKESEAMKIMDCVKTETRASKDGKVSHVTCYMKASSDESAKDVKVIMEFDAEKKTLLKASNVEDKKAESDGKEDDDKKEKTGN